jgi:hypothetical protein
MAFLLARLACVAGLVFALGPHPPEFPRLLHTSLFVVALYGALRAGIAYSRFAWGLLFAGSALVFNPFVPIPAGPEIWKIVYQATALLFVISIPTARGIR